jgi:hypothetical protein
MHQARRDIDHLRGAKLPVAVLGQMNRGDQWRRLEQWPGVRRAGLPRQSPPLTPGQRRRKAPP